MRKLGIVATVVATLLALALVPQLGRATPTPQQLTIPIGVYLPLVYQVPPTAAPATATNAPVLPTLTATPTRTATRTPTATELITIATETPTATNDPALCAAEYPTVCIPPPPPDLNCGDITFRRFTVLPPDRHNFDTDNDGIGCESG